MAGALSAVMPANDIAEADEYLTVEPLEGESEFHHVETDDGGLIATLPGTKDAVRPAKNGKFYRNLAEHDLPEAVVSRIVTDLLRKIEADKTARERRDKQYEEGLRRSGLGKDAPGGADFEGASRVVHPGLMQADIDFVSRVMKELWPPSGPVKPKILGKVTKDKDERAKRKTDYMNWQLTTQIEEARNVVETTLTQVPLGGSQFIRLWHDDRMRRPRMQFIPVDQVYLPAAAESFTSAHRRTFVDFVDEVEFRLRINSGLYRELNLPRPAQVPDRSKSEKANQKIEGKTDDVENLDGEREIYETMSYIEITPEIADHLDVEEEGQILPYLVSIDLNSRQGLALYRDWEPDDPTHEAVSHLYEIPFLPWRGALSVGLPHVIGGLSGAATGALRALLDSAHIANTQGGLLLKGSGTGGQTQQAQFGEFTEIQGGLETDDIRKKVMPFATKEPSNVLFQLLGFLDTEMKGAVRTSLDDSAIDTNANTPVGTQLSRVEEGLVVFSAIHGRVHAAFNRLLSGLHRLNRMYLPAVQQLDVEGKELFIQRADFMGALDVAPVSEPTVYSDQQRMAQIAAVQQRAALKPGLYKERAVEERFLTLIKIPNPSELLVDQPQPHELNAVNENVSMAFGKPVVAFPEQDHLAHMQVHLDFLVNPVLGSNPIIEPKFLPSALQHIAEHIVFFYVKMNTDLVRNAANVESAADLMGNDDELKQMFDRLLAAASTHVTPNIPAVFEKVLPTIQQAMQKMQRYMPPPPLDPARASVQIAQGETTRKTHADQTTAALKKQELAADQDRENRRAQIDAERNAIAADANNARRDVAEIGADTRIRTTAMDNETAEMISEDRIASGSKSTFKNGESLAGSGS